MASKDLKNDILVVDAFNTQVISSDTATTGEIIDTQGYEGLTFVVKTGVVTAGDVTLSLFDGDDSGLSDVSAVDSDFVIGDYTTIDASNTVVRVGYVGHKRYIRPTLTTANSANLTVGMVAIKSTPREMPTS